MNLNLDNKESHAFIDKLSDTKYSNSEPKAEREVDHDDGIKRSADIDLEEEKENDCEKDVSSNPHALYKSMSGLQEDIQLAGICIVLYEDDKYRIYNCKINNSQKYHFAGFCRL